VYVARDNEDHGLVNSVTTRSLEVDP